MLYRLNTSNLGKFQEFQHLFAKHHHELIATHIDLREIDSDPITVITHKASQMEEGVIVDDTLMDIEDSAVGIHIKWFLKHLSEFIGRKAVWTVLLALRDSNQVKIFHGQVEGKIVAARGEGGFGFDPVFMPLESNKTLAEYKPAKWNARAIAVDALLEGKPFAVRDVMKDWHGKWQK